MHPFTSNFNSKIMFKNTNHREKTMWYKLLKANKNKVSEEDNVYVLQRMYYNMD